MAADSPIFAKFCNKDAISDSNDFQNGSQPLSWKSLYDNISVKYGPILMKFRML